VARFRLSRRAAADFDDIAEFTRDRWGDSQASRYLGDLNDCFHRVAENPLLGRSCEDLCSGCWRIEQGSHVVFFRRDDDGVFIVRVLHERMLPTRHLKR
jgi:toxin ParE1/3/4